MRAADVFVLPSTREGFGLTFPAAMAADCMVVATNYPDSTAGEVIGDAGFLVELTVNVLAEMLACAVDESVRCRIRSSVHVALTGVRSRRALKPFTSVRLTGRGTVYSSVVGGREGLRQV